jgi:hypothetical protein
VLLAPATWLRAAGQQRQQQLLRVATQHQQQQQQQAVDWLMKRSSWMRHFKGSIGGYYLCSSWISCA